MMTVSPGRISTLRWVERAIRVKADIGSPWLPVHRMTTRSAAILLTSSGSMMIPSGTFK
ncbi:hypothetical protein D3C76_1580450 [compost metagenome]